MTPAEEHELLKILRLGEGETSPPELLFGRVGPGEGVPTWGLLKDGIVHTRPADPRAALLAAQFIEEYQ